MSFQRKNKWFLLLFGLLLIGAYSTYKYIYKPHKSTEEMTVDYKGDSDVFLSKVKDDTSVWLGKTVELSGIITSKDKKGITLSNQIYCQFREDIDFSLLKKQQRINIKGRIIGYDDLLDELKLNECIIQE